MRRTSAERRADDLWASGDRRPRCDEAAHLLCRDCDACACATDLDPMEYPTGRLVVSTDKRGRTLCRECRYQADLMA